MSHGCTHVNAGHIAELRQMLPAETERLYDVDVFYNQSQLYDVFDIDGDLAPEVMGVRYFVAYSLRGKTPDRLRAPIERHAYYDWLYAGELDYDAADRGRLPRRARRPLRRPERASRARATRRSRCARRRTSRSGCSSIAWSTSRSRARSAR